VFWNRIPPSRNQFSVLILSVISAKDDVNPPSFKICSFAPRHRNTSKDHCVFVSCWAFLCRSGSGFLAEPTSSTRGYVRLFCFFPPSSNIFFPKKMRNPSGMTKNVVPPVLYSNMFSRQQYSNPKIGLAGNPQRKDETMCEEKTRKKMPF